MRFLFKIPYTKLIFVFFYELYYFSTNYTDGIRVYDAIAVMVEATLIYLFTICLFLHRSIRFLEYRIAIFPVANPIARCHK